MIPAWFTGQNVFVWHGHPLLSIFGFRSKDFLSLPVRQLRIVYFDFSKNLEMRDHGISFRRRNARRVWKFISLFFFLAPKGGPVGIFKDFKI